MNSQHLFGSGERPQGSVRLDDWSMVLNYLFLLLYRGECEVSWF